MFHCFDISKHISVSVLFFTISVSCYLFLCWIFEIIAQGVGFSTIFLPQGSESRTSLCPGVGIRPFKKIFPGGLPGGIVRLGIY